MDIPEISIYKFHDLLMDTFGSETKFENIDIKTLTAPGENYGSLMLAINLEIRNNENDEKVESLHLVAKLVPSNEFIQNFMNTRYTFRNELGFYKIILPCLKEFLKDQECTKICLDMFPKFFGGRLSLDSSKAEADNDAVILLQNLKAENYCLLDRRVGFDFETSKLILRKLAEFHAVALALKINRPDLFEQLMSYFEEFHVLQISESKGSVMASEFHVNNIIEMLEGDEVCSLHMDKIQDALKLGALNINLPKNSPNFRKKQFATLVHGDVWINNIMVKMQKHKITDVKFLDLQLYEYISVTVDVLFFLFTSVQDQVLRDNPDELIVSYYNNLIVSLEELKCGDINKFSFEAFQKEMKETANEISFIHVLAVQDVIFVEEKDACEVEKFHEDQIAQQVKASSGACKNKVRLIAREFIRRGWI